MFFPDWPSCRKFVEENFEAGILQFIPNSPPQKLHIHFVMEEMSFERTEVRIRQWPHPVLLIICQNLVLMTMHNFPSLQENLYVNLMKWSNTVSNHSFLESLCQVKAAICGCLGFNGNHLSLFREFQIQSLWRRGCSVLRWPLRLRTKSGGSLKWWHRLQNSSALCHCQTG